MKFKELLTKIFSGIASDEEKNTFWDCIDTNDELAELLCDAHIPEIMELICENEFIRRKPYFRKYDLICSLYSSNMEIACTFDCEQLKNEIAPFLKVEHIDKLITQLALREAAIKTIIEKKELLKEQLLQLKDKIARTQKAHEKTKEATEKPTFQKKKHPSKQEEQLELLSKELDWVKAQERLLVTTYKSPSKMIDYLRAYRYLERQR